MLHDKIEVRKENIEDLKAIPVGGECMAIM
jgi:hypothetical protein